MLTIESLMLCPTLYTGQSTPQHIYGPIASQPDVFPSSPPTHSLTPRFEPPHSALMSLKAVLPVSRQPSQTYLRTPSERSHPIPDFPEDKKEALDECDECDEREPKADPPPRYSAKATTSSSFKKVVGDAATKHKEDDEDQFAALARFNTVILLDDSSSMTIDGRWTEVCLDYSGGFL